MRIDRVQVSRVIVVPWRKCTMPIILVTWKKDTVTNIFEPWKKCTVPMKVTKIKLYTGRRLQCSK